MSAPPIVLVVEDDPSVLRLIQFVLAAEGYRLLTAGSAEEALRILLEHPVDVMVLDLVLPGMGGRELAWRLQESGRCPGMVLMSGYADADAALAVLDPSLATFLDKPFDVHDLRAKVREQMERVRVA